MAASKTLTGPELRAFLRGGQVKRGVHSLTKKILHWPYCANCGLMALNNEATRKRLKGPCVYVD